RRVDIRVARALAFAGALALAVALARVAAGARLTGTRTVALALAGARAARLDVGGRLALALGGDLRARLDVDVADGRLVLHLEGRLSLDGDLLHLVDAAPHLGASDLGLFLLELGGDHADLFADHDAAL